MQHPSKLLIRRMQLQDIDVVHEIDRISFSTPWPRRSYEFELTQNPAGHLWVAEIEEAAGQDRIIGMLALWLIMDEVHIGTLATHPDYRRQGVASRLLSEALRFAIQAGAQIATLDVRVGNIAAQALYQRFGFVVTGLHRAYYHSDNEDAYLMTASNLDKARLDKLGALKSI